MATTGPELLARHCAAAGMAERAVRHWRRAAERAVGRAANPEAVGHCEQAEVQLATLPPSPERARAELEVQLVRGAAVRAGRGYAAPESERVFLRACELCEELGDRVRLVHALRGLFGFYHVAARRDDAVRAAMRIRAAAEGLDDRLATCVRCQVEGMIRLYLGEPAAASAGFLEALRHYEEGDRDAHVRLSGHETGAWIRYHLAHAEWLAGAPARALRTCEEGLVLARRGGRPFSLAQTLANSALLCILAQTAPLTATKEEAGLQRWPGPPASRQGTANEREVRVASSRAGDRDDPSFHPCPCAPGCAYRGSSAASGSDAFDRSFVDTAYCISLRSRPDRAASAAAEFQPSPRARPNPRARHLADVGRQELTG